MEPIERTDVLGVGISALTMDAAVHRIREWIRAGVRTYVCVCPVHTVMECRRSPELMRIVNSAGMVTPDGMPMVWLSWAGGHRHVERVYGPDLMLATIRQLSGPNYRHFFYGGGEGVAEELAARLRQRFPDMVIAGMMSPTFGDAESLADDETVREINNSEADIVWVGLSSPKQDRWMALTRERLRASVLIGVGAAFDIHSGQVRQAPRWIQRAGVEWLFRLLHEPRRLWRRYLVDNFLFVFTLIRERAVTSR